MWDSCGKEVVQRSNIVGLLQKRSGPKIKYCGTTAGKKRCKDQTLWNSCRKEVVWRSNIVGNYYQSFNQFINLFNKVFHKLLVTLFCFNLQMRTLCQTLSPFGTSRKIPLISKPSSIDWYISCFNGWRWIPMHTSP